MEGIVTEWGIETETELSYYNVPPTFGKHFKALSLRYFFLFSTAAAKRTTGGLMTGMAPAVEAL